MTTDKSPFPPAPDDDGAAFEQALEFSRSAFKTFGVTDDRLHDYARPLADLMTAYAASRITALKAEVEKYQQLDREAATYVESVICMRTGFTGDPPYVGWKGLGLALNEALDERDALRAENAELLEAAKFDRAVTVGKERVAYARGFNDARDEALTIAGSAGAWVVAAAISALKPKEQGE
jgi:hypothetical protein